MGDSEVVHKCLHTLCMKTSHEGEVPEGWTDALAE